MMYHFASDYQEGAAPTVLARLLSTNMESTAAYGEDEYSASAREKIRLACACPKASVHFFIGGTQTNAVTLSALLFPYEGVIAASSGHISVHEAGAVERFGHKVLELSSNEGKLLPREVMSYVQKLTEDENRDHMVMPGAVYISQPTEYGTLYSLSELEELSSICREYDLRFYVDGARLAYALGSPVNDVSLQDLARLCDAFYIGGTKCGALFGEALVIPNPHTLSHFFTIMKQHGAVLAKGRLLGLQFDSLFTDDLYTSLGRKALAAAEALRKGLLDLGAVFEFPPQTNQLFLPCTSHQLSILQKLCTYSFWEKKGDEETVIRLCAGWATELSTVSEFISDLKEHGFHG